MEKRKRRVVNVTENYVRVVFSIIQMKAAAQHFETAVASHIACGSDMGDLGHGRKQFNEIMYSAEVALDLEVAEYLVTPLKSTKLPPHFYATADKATINRVTNQAVFACGVVNGNRRAIAVSASAVYAMSNREENEGRKIEISGAHANQLADLMYDDIKKTYGFSDELSLWIMARNIL